jgi:DNA-directed RNA polymerase subunit RPC12/RpoP
MLRVHRTPFEKIVWSDMFECAECGHRAGTYYNALYANSRFLFSRYSRCIRCGSEAVQRLAKRDKVDGFSQHPLALIQAVVGAPVNRCSPCRLQFFDWRKPRPGALPDS